MKKITFSFLTLLLLVVVVGLASCAGKQCRYTTGQATQQTVVSESWVLFTPGSFIFN